MKTARDLFYGARLKLERADQHIHELNDVFNAFLQTDFYDFWLEHDPQSGDNLVRFRCNKGIPRGVETVIGDALHNLRSALDLTASELVRLAGKTPGKHIRFPVRATREELETTIKGGEIQVAHQSILDIITNEVKPYIGGNDALYTLHALDITDKHHDVIPVVAISGVRLSAKIGAMTLEDCLFGVRVSNEMCVVSSPENIEIQGEPKPMFTILFDKGQPFEGQTVIPTLTQLSQLVSGIVNAIKNAYIRSVQSTA